MMTFISREYELCPIIDVNRNQRIQLLGAKTSFNNALRDFNVSTQMEKVLSVVLIILDSLLIVINSLSQFKDASFD